MDVLLVFAIVGFAVACLFRNFYKKWKKGGECSSCDACTAFYPVIKKR